MQYFFGIMTFLTSVFLILLILIQRGRGGGLAGALGGMGGQSAFGTKAGDLFTRITVGVAAFWILLSVAAIGVLNSSRSSVFGEGDTGTSTSVDGTKTDGDKSTAPTADGKAATDGKTESDSKAGAPAASGTPAAPAAPVAPAAAPAPPAAAPPADAKESAPAAPAGDSNAEKK